MSTLNDALARERMRHTRNRARDAALARELAATRRWHRVSAYARAAERRHAARATRAAVDH